MTRRTPIVLLHLQKVICGEVVQDDANTFFYIALVCLDVDFGALGRFVRSRDTGEV